jgi:hypothetical protein
MTETTTDRRTIADLIAECRAAYWTKRKRQYRDSSFS